MAVYNLGTLAQPQEEVNPYMAMLMDFGSKALLQRQQIKGQKEIAESTEKIRTSAEAARQAAELKYKEDTYAREVMSAQMQAFVDKHYDYAKGEIDKNTVQAILATPDGKAMIGEWRRLNPQYKDIKDDLNTLPSPGVEVVANQLKEQVAGLKRKMIENPNKIDPRVVDLIARIEGKETATARAFYKLQQSDPDFVPDLQDPRYRDEAMKKLELAIKMEFGEFDVGSNTSGMSNALNPNPRQPLFYGPTARFSGVGNAPISQEATPQETKLKVKRFKPIP